MLNLLTFCAVAMTKESLVQDLSMVLLVAGGVAALFHAFDWPKVIGYITAGAILALPPIKRVMIADEDSVVILANLGVIFLMFTMGLELNFKKLKKLGGTVFPSACADLCLMLLVGYAVGHFIFKWEFLPSLFLGAVICDSSTTLLAKSLAEMGCARERFASIIFGITISEDVLTIGIMAVLTGLAITGHFQTAELALQLGYLGLFLAGVLGFGLLLLPRLLNSLVSRLKDDETVLLISIGICFGISLIAEKMQFSLALGAFLVGAVISQSKIRQRVMDYTKGLRAVFSAVFFVTIGMMVNLPSVWAYKWYILLLIGVVLVFKTLNNMIVCFVTGQSFRESAQIGVGLAQLGDFAYLVAMMGIYLQNGESPYPEMYQVAVGVSIVTTLLNPFLLKTAGPLADSLFGRFPSAVQKCLLSYTSWMNRARGKLKTHGYWKPFVMLCCFFGLNLMLMAVIYMVGAWFIQYDKLWSSLPESLKKYDEVMVWGLCFLLCCPLFINGFLLGRRMGKIIGDTIFPMSSTLGKSALAGKTTSMRWYAMLRNVLAAMVFIASMVLMLGVFCCISLLVSFQWEMVLVLAVVITLFVFYKRERFMVFIHDTQGALQEMLEARDEESVEEVVSDRQLTETGVVIPKGAGVIGVSLKKLRLRNHTGATLSRILREDGSEDPSPGPDSCLQAGDTAFLLCEPGREAATRQYLCQAKVEVHDESLLSFLDMRVETLAVSAGSTVCGRRLAELKLRNTLGVTVVKIVCADGVVQEMPGPDDKLEVGDQVWLLGTGEQLACARRLLETEGHE